MNYTTNLLYIVLGDAINKSTLCQCSILYFKVSQPIQAIDSGTVLKNIQQILVYYTHNV